MYIYFGNKALQKLLDKVAVYHSYETGTRQCPRSRRE